MDAARAGWRTPRLAMLGFDARLEAELDGAVNRALGERRIPGAVVAIGRGDRPPWIRAYGMIESHPEPIPMPESALFDLASLTKPIATACVVMKWYEQGKLDLNDPITKHLHEFAPHGKQRITIEQLLRHRGGLIADNALDDYAGGPEAAWRNLANLPLQSPPGTRFVYSDVGFLILGRLAEQIGGKPLDQLARELVFEPAGMSRTGFSPLQDPLRVPTEAIVPTEPDESGKLMRGVVHDPRARALGGVAGHAGLFGTAEDLCRFARMILAHGHSETGVQVLRAETVRLMCDPGNTPPRERRGLGWDISTPYSRPRGAGSSRPPGRTGFGPRSFGHTGFTGTSLWIDPDTETYVILLTSSRYGAWRGADVGALRAELSTLAASALLDSPQPVLPGIDVLAQQGFLSLKGKRIGLVTNQTGQTRDGRSTIDVLHQAPGVQLLALFSPEHGIRGGLDSDVPDDRDPGTGLPIHSLYGPTRKPRPEQLAGLDALVFDLQDIGTRFYTYISTLGLCMEATAVAEIPLYVLDRPNPIGGLVRDGPIAARDSLSFIAYHAIPVRHGLTMGELARLYQHERDIPCDLIVIPCSGWSRRMTWDQTGLEWVNPSPNMRSLTQALLYPAVGLLESTNLATGRGTDTPFERVGAPWIDGREWAVHLNRASIPGVRFTPITFTPRERQYRGQSCHGVFVMITDRSRYDPMRLAFTLAHSLRTLYPNAWEPTGFGSMLGNPAADAAFPQAPTYESWHTTWRAELEAFNRRVEPHLIYP